MRSAMNVLAVLGLLLVLHARPAAAAPDSPDGEPPAPTTVEPSPPPREIPARRVSISHLVVATYNALGAEYQLKPGLQYRLNKSDDLLLHDTFTFAGAFIRLSPVYATAGPLVEWQPLAIINLRARAEALGYFKSLGVLQSWRSPYDDHSDTAQSLRNAAGENYSTYGLHATVEPTLQAQVGPIAVQNHFSLDYWNMRLHSGDTVWYDAGPDHAIPGNGFTLLEEASLVYLRGPLTAGLNFRYAAPLFTEANFRPGEDPHGLNESNSRLGAIFAYTFFNRGYTPFDQPTVFVLVQWWLHHHYRTGQDVSGVIPFVAVGFSFQQDFIF